MLTSLSISDVHPFNLFCLCIWREARGEVNIAQQGVAWSIRNRVLKPGWWGHDWAGVILMPLQYSSFNKGDPNSTKFPVQMDTSWQDIVLIARSIFTTNPGVGDSLELPDPTGGADSYFDKSLDSNPPKWALSDKMAKTCDLGNLHFYKTL